MNRGELSIIQYEFWLYKLTERQPLLADKRRTCFKQKSILEFDWINLDLLVFCFFNPAPFRITLFGFELKKTTTKKKKKNKVLLFLRQLDLMGFLIHHSCTDLMVSAGIAVVSVPEKPGSSQTAWYSFLMEFALGILSLLIPPFSSTSSLSHSAVREVEKWWRRRWCVITL